MTLSTLIQRSRTWLRTVAIALLASMVGLMIGVNNPAYADTAEESVEYIAADGSDLTAVAQCLPQELSQPSLARALSESGNDFLEKVFDVKDDYGDYELDSTEVEYLNCLKQTGVTPQVER
ncbi:hypothetical protein XM38_024110 [Halomicronema hongdechloris C2206]|uniref:Uncharacterized protein n=1 Tax=Halomicronema hongdechloris C2206 TaxID=1641165 RepID=A0A1Z3HMC0_9CYAN|nr:hypothetical protein [Halomicronema hongdechloris]ASC71459.1 hypothetical protein XM38_024110 [Halomicronema hongdechloris C2206]